MLAALPRTLPADSAFGFPMIRHIHHRAGSIAARGIDAGDNHARSEVVLGQYRRFARAPPMPRTRLEFCAVHPGPTLEAVHSLRNRVSMKVPLFASHSVRSMRSERLLPMEPRSTPYGQHGLVEWRSACRTTAVSDPV